MFENDNGIGFDARQLIFVDFRGIIVIIELVIGRRFNCDQLNWRR